MIKIFGDILITGVPDRQTKRQTDKQSDHIPSIDNCDGSKNTNGSKGCLFRLVKMPLPDVKALPNANNAQVNCLLLKYGKLPCIVLTSGS